MYQSKISNLIIRMKKARNENPEMTFQKISDDTGVSKSTVQRIFADNSENQTFRVESLKPIAELLLGSNALEEDMDYDEFQLQLAEIKDKYERKLEKEREQHRRSVEFLMKQIKLKDGRITALLKLLIITMFKGDKSKLYLFIDDKEISSEQSLEEQLITEILEKD